jgi:hypothetical protein
VGKVTLKNNGDEALSYKSRQKSNEDEVSAKTLFAENKLLSPMG